MAGKLVISAVPAVWTLLVGVPDKAELAVDCELSVPIVGVCENESRVVRVVSVEVWDIVEGPVDL